MNLEMQLKRKIVDGICYFLIKVFTVGLIVREMALASTMILLINEMVRKVKSILMHQDKQCRYKKEKKFSISDTLTRYFFDKRFVGLCNKFEDWKLHHTTSMYIRGAFL